MSDESLETRVSVHEAVCAQRYESIQNRLDDGSKRMSRIDRKSTRLNSSHMSESRMPSSA